MTAPNSNIRKVVFADFAITKYHTLIQWLKQEGVVAEAVTDVPKFLSLISDQPYDVCVVNLLLGGMGPFELISNLRSVSKNPEIKIIVVSRQVQRININNTIRAGANDFIAEPFENLSLFNRILFHLTPKKVLDPLGYEKSATSHESQAYLNLMLEATELLAKTERGKEHSSFWIILKNISDLIGSNRTSLLIVDSENDSGVVLASSDDPAFHDYPLSLEKYPEILNVMTTGNFVLIEDVSQNSLTQKINEKVRSIAIGSIMVFPVRFQGEVMGVLVIRRPKAKELPSLDTLRVLQALANTMAAHSSTKALLRRVYREFKPAKTGT